MAEFNFNRNHAAYLAAIIASSDDIIVSKTLDGIVTSWNPAAERILGYSSDEAVGKHIRLIIPPELWSEEDEVLARLRRGERVDHFETKRRTKDGRLLDISLTVSPIRAEDGTIIGASKVARNITERKRLDEEREKLYSAEKLAREMAEQASRSKDEFLAMVSHELRSPLNAISGWASLLKSGSLKNDERAVRGLEVILQNVRAQDQLINDLLDISRIVSGRMRLNVRPFDLIPTIEAVVEVMSPAAAAKGIRLQLVLDPGASRIAGDPDRLHQVFANLLSNSIKFTPKGGRVQVRLERINSHIEISVNDTGEGVDPDLLPHVFELFRQGDSTTTRKQRGLGLGLGIARSLVELHGGTITAYSEGVGKGAQFVVRLPLMISVQHHGEERTHPAAGDYIPSDVPALSGVRILLVDDEPDSLETVSLLLSQAGAEVSMASSAAQAVEMFLKSVPDVLISDIGMPDEDGYSLMRRIRALPNGASVPAVALTAFARAHDRIKALEAGYQVHVPKPVDVGELANIIAILIRRS